MFLWTILPLIRTVVPKSASLFFFVLFPSHLFVFIQSLFPPCILYCISIASICVCLAYLSVLSFLNFFSDVRTYELQEWFHRFLVCYQEVANNKQVIFSMRSAHKKTQKNKADSVSLFMEHFISLRLCTLCRDSGWAMHTILSNSNILTGHTRSIAQKMCSTQRA